MSTSQCKASGDGFGLIEFVIFLMLAFAIVNCIESVGRDVKAIREHVTQSPPGVQP